MDPLLKELRHNPVLWLLALVPVALVAAKLVPAAHTLLFILSVLAIVPLALFLDTIALVSPSAIAKADLVPATALTQKLTIALAVLLIAGYGLGLLFSLKTHREIFASAEHAEPSEPAWPIGLALVTLAVVTVLVALVTEIFVESVQKAAEAFGMSQAFVGFIVVALVGA